MEGSTVTTKYKQINSFAFTGIADPREGQHRSEMSEVDEEEDILGCTERFDRYCAHVRPLKLLKVDVPDGADTRRIPVLVNDDVRVEVMTTKSPSETAHEEMDGWSEVHIQVENQRVSRTPQGETSLDPSDLLVVPAGTSHESFGDEPSTRLIVRTRRPVQVAKGYPEKDGSSEGGLIHLRPSQVTESIEEGASGGKHFELVANEDIMIETTFRSDDQRIYHRGYNQDEVHFQLSGRRATRTSQGEYLLETGDMLLIPPGVAHRNVGGMPTIRIVLYTKSPLRVSDEYRERLQTVWGS
jgi:mannose-6-phosphate isomerase-like protein (cupin superfamily)